MDALQKATRDFQNLQQQLAVTVEARQKLDYQLTESEGVLKEMQILQPENTVYKLIGPALIEQDQAEAKTTVEKRLEFIKKEIDRIEAQLKDIEEKSQAKKMEVIKLQSENQAANQGQAGPSSNQQSAIKA